MTDLESYVGLTDSSGDNTGQSQELRDFEAYSRRLLPAMVEGFLQDEIAPHVTLIEAHIRPRLVEIVQTTFSTLLHNFRLDNSQSGLPLRKAAGKHSPRMSSLAQTIQNVLLEDVAGIAIAGITAESPDLAQPLYSSTMEASSSVPVPSHDYSELANSLFPDADSGSIGLISDCTCICHDFFNFLADEYCKILLGINFDAVLMFDLVGNQSCETCARGCIRRIISNEISA